jgi:hypothetical protein
MIRESKQRTYATEAEFATASKELQLDGWHAAKITVLWRRETPEGQQGSSFGDLEERQLFTEKEAQKKATQKTPKPRTPEQIHGLT